MYLGQHLRRRNWVSSFVDRFLDWVPFNKTRHDRLNKCEILYLRVIIHIINKIVRVDAILYDF